MLKVKQPVLLLPWIVAVALEITEDNTLQYLGGLSKVK
jgi:hypothetical protein